MTKKVVLLINLGTPDSPSVKDVRKYLREFLMDGRVLDIPFIQRFFLVNGIIAPFRSPNSAKIYQQLWTKEGSPLKIYGEKVKELLQKNLGSNYVVEFAMRYQHPPIKDIIKPFSKKNIDELIVIPLYPQYASSTTGSTVEKLFEELKTWQNIPDIRIISQFFNHPLFIEAFAFQAQKWMQKCQYEHFVFSYHGLPVTQIKKASVDDYCQLSETCCSVYHTKNQYCYRAQCFQTTRLLAQRLNIPSDKYTICFQSRLGKTPWIQPYTEDVIANLAQKGIKNVLAFSPAFVADCLETTIEVGHEYQKLFIEKGGKRWDLVESLNTSDLWIDCLKNIVINKK